MRGQTQTPDTAAEQYLDRTRRYGEEIIALGAASRRFSNLRLLVFVAAVAVPIFAYNTGHLLIAAGSLIGGFALFFLLVIRHGIVIDRLEAANRLLRINQEGTGRLAGDWKGRKDQGVEFLDRSHPYAVDLDIFGANSIYQWICAAHTPAGRRRFAELLSRPATLDELPARQQALEELGGKLEWRQRFEEAAMSMEESQWDSLLAWAEAPTVTWFQSGLVRALRYLPVVTLVGGGLAYFFGAGEFPLSLLIGVQIIVVIAVTRRLRPHIAALEKQSSISGLEASLRLVEEEEFTSDLTRRLKGAIAREETSATTEIGALRSPVGWLQMRNNPPVHFALNALFLWDLQWVARAEEWRRRNGSSIRGWLASLAEFEALGSLAIIPFENPEWPLPEVTRDRAEPLDAVEIGHPLLRKEVRVSNSLRIERPGSVCIITGSNMSGKSTFLRTVGVNLVLAYAGLPVCARSFACAYLPLHTSMRVTDDLGAGVSSFYAELLRVRTIIEASRVQPVFWLIDEIFRGTNSRDRLAGSRAVLLALSSVNSTGLVSTHDLELSQLAGSDSQHFRNYHFSERYTEDEIVFDHLLQPGESKTTNAMYLMKRLGILQN